MRAAAPGAGGWSDRRSHGSWRVGGWSDAASPGRGGGWSDRTGLRPQVPRWQRHSPGFVQKQQRQRAPVLGERATSSFPLAARQRSCASHPHHPRPSSVGQVHPTAPTRPDRCEPSPYALDGFSSAAADEVLENQLVEGLTSLACSSSARPSAPTPPPPPQPPMVEELVFSMVRPTNRPPARERADVQPPTLLALLRAHLLSRSA